MAKLNVLQFPDPRLRIKAREVTDFGEETQRIIVDMIDTLYAVDDAGAYAATQMDIHQRIVVIDRGEYKRQRHAIVLINPRIIERSKELVWEEEACMSVPGGIWEKVERAAKVKVVAFDAEGREFSLDCEDYLARCIQHEIDHLNGVLFVDYLSPLKRQRIQKRLEKLRKQQVI